MTDRIAEPDGRSLKKGPQAAARVRPAPAPPAAAHVFVMNEVSRPAHTPQTPTARRRAPDSARAALAQAATALAAALLLNALAPPAHAAAVAAHARRRQQDKPQIANEVEKADKKAADRKESEKEPGRAPDANGKGQGVKVKKVQPPRPYVPQLEVNFKTDLPEAEIFLYRGSGDMLRLGKTDAEGRLTARLARGRHNIIASRPGARILRQQIEVQSDRKDFTFNLALPPPPEKKEVEETAQAAPTPDDSAKVEQTDKATTFNSEDVVRRFLDAGESASVPAADWQQVREQSRAALAKEPDNRQLQAQSLLADGQLAYLGNDYATALVSFNKAIIASPDYVAAHYGLGNAYLATNQPAEAFNAYQRAAALNKEFALAYKGMGDALTKQNKNKEATAYYKRAQGFGQTLPTNASLTAARDLKKRKRWGEAVRDFEEIARTQPTAEVFTDIGDCYVGLEQPLSASKAYLKATELDPKAALAFYKYGEVMFRLREYAAAMEALERALALDTTGAQFNRGKARERANEAAKKLGLKKDK